jgi:hypothetical protein
MLKMQLRRLLPPTALALAVSLGGRDAGATSYVTLVAVDEVRGCNELVVSDAVHPPPWTRDGRFTCGTFNASAKIRAICGRSRE